VLFVVWSLGLVFVIGCWMLQGFCVWCRLRSNASCMKVVGRQRQAAVVKCAGLRAYDSNVGVCMDVWICVFIVKCLLCVVGRGCSWLCVGAVMHVCGSLEGRWLLHAHRVHASARQSFWLLVSSSCVPARGRLGVNSIQSASNGDSCGCYGL